MDHKLAFAPVEIDSLEQVSDVTPLNDLQLAFVGGGCGEVVFG